MLESLIPILEKAFDMQDKSKVLVYKGEKYKCPCNKKKCTLNSLAPSSNRQWISRT